MSYILDQTPIINMPSDAEHPIIEELLTNYTYGEKWKVLHNSTKNTITIGNYTKVERKNSEYVINVTDGGIYIEGCNYQAMMRGFVTFLNDIKYSHDSKYFYLEECCIYDSPSINFRCVHLCIFPETNLDFLKKTIRCCAIAKYSHIIFEFWGMLKYECMKELAWPFAFSKETIKKLSSEANFLGVEIIPMFNHMGHASSCREMNGKHVVLDQNPKYEYMFESYGWIWNFKREDVQELHKKIREELIEVCGKGSYFHIGCDETYAYGHDEKNAGEMIKYLNSVSKDLKSQGRRCIMWGDMVLSSDDFEGYQLTSSKAVSNLILENLDKDILIADWQYVVDNETWKTSKKLKENNFNVVCCPWESIKNINEAINTVTENNLHGIIHTTWHTLFKGFSHMIYAGFTAYGVKDPNYKHIHKFYCASIARKALPSNGEYEKSGWSEKMTGPGL